eukprot:487133-Hanusia_phi.AAC.1
MMRRKKRLVACRSSTNVRSEAIRRLAIDAHSFNQTQQSVTGQGSFLSPPLRSAPLLSPFLFSPSLPSSPLFSSPLPSPSLLSSPSFSFDSSPHLSPSSAAWEGGPAAKSGHIVAGDRLMSVDEVRARAGPGEEGSEKVRERGTRKEQRSREEAVEGNRRREVSVSMGFQREITADMSGEDIAQLIVGKRGSKAKLRVKKQQGGAIIGSLLLLLLLLLVLLILLLLIPVSSCFMLFFFVSRLLLASSTLYSCPSLQKLSWRDSKASKRKVPSLPPPSLSLPHPPILQISSRTNLPPQERTRSLPVESSPLAPGKLQLRRAPSS